MKKQYEFLNVKEVAALLGASVSTIWRWSKEGTMPKPMKFGVQITRWKKSDLENFLKNPEQWHEQA